MMATGWPACSAGWAGGAKSTAVESGVTGHSTTRARDSHPKHAVVDQSARALTTKATKVHEGNARDQETSWYFVSLVVQAFWGVASFLCSDRSAAGNSLLESYGHMAPDLDGQNHSRCEQQRSDGN